MSKNLNRISSAHVIQSPKMVNFNHTEAGLTSQWGRILPAVRWCSQNLYNCIVRQCTKYVTQRQRDTGNGLYSEVALVKIESGKNQYIKYRTQVHPMLGCREIAIFQRRRIITLPPLQR